MKRIRAATLLLALTLAGCGVHAPQPLPADKAAYAGDWTSKTMTLRITPEGNVTYHRTDANGKVSIDAPIEAFHGNNFDVGLGPLKTTFYVSQPPHQENGQWKMVVDGVPLTRTADAGEQPAPRTAPAPAPSGNGVQI